LYNVVCAGAIDERTVEPATKTDDRRQTVPTQVGYVVVVVVVIVILFVLSSRCLRLRVSARGQSAPAAANGSCGSATTAVAPQVLAAGFQLRRFPKAAGHGQRVAGERDHTVAGQADRGHGQGAQPVLRQGRIHPVHA